MNRLMLNTLVFTISSTLFGQGMHKQDVPAADVIQKMLVRDAEREAQSGGYSGIRRYTLENERLHKTAELVAVVRCDPSGTKHFEVISETGWSVANNRVLHKVLESESEASTPAIRSRSALIPANYSFSLARTELAEGRLAYVIDVVPTRNDKFLMQGRVWVDASDYALVRAEGKLAHNPSFWTRSVSFVQRYQKKGEFWFPASTDSTSEVRMFGKTHVTVAYSDYIPNADSSFQQMSRKEMIYAVH